MISQNHERQPSCLIVEIAGSGGDKDENGRPAGLDLSQDMLRMLVIQSRDV